jgi:hypothetical protein
MKSLSTAALALLLVLAHPAVAQTANVDASTNSASNANANSGSVSGAASNSDQTQGQSQGQSQGQVLTATQGQAATQANGQSITFNTPAQPKKVTVENQANQNVPLAAAVSFSSDYCGGTASGGVSTSLGFSIGGAKPIMDANCQSLRRAEKFSIVAATAHNMGFKEWGAKLIAMSIWELCMSEQNDSPRDGAKTPSTRDACEKLKLYGDQPFPPASASAAPDTTAAASYIASAQRDEQARQAAAPRP